MPLTDDDVREILRIIDESPLEELRIETNGLSLHVSKTPTPHPGASHDPVPAAPVRAAAPGSGAPAPAPATVAPTPGEAPAEEAGDEASEAARRGGVVTIDAPLLGAFYRAQGPGQPPFVEVGSSVEPGTIVAIIEVMKMMNSVTAGVSGTIVEIVPENAQLVEYGQPLFRVQPA